MSALCHWPSCPAPALQQPSSQYAFPATRFLDTLLPCSAGKCRELGRRLDYWMIASSSALLTRALYPGLPVVATALSLASTPFKPFLVTTGNAMAMEGKFLHRALRNPGGVKGLGLVGLVGSNPNNPGAAGSWFSGGHFTGA